MTRKISRRRVLQACGMIVPISPLPTAALVGGKINPKGWCLLFAQKPK